MTTLSKGRILITDKVHHLLIDGLTKAGFEVDYDTSVEMPVLPNIIGNYVGIIINSKIKMRQEMIDLGHQLRFIARLGSGMEIIDATYARSKGIEPINSPEGNRNAVAEHAIGMLLAFANNLCRANIEVKNFDWNREKNRGLELEGKTLGIIGFGNTGESLARKMSSWHLNILSFDKYRPFYTEDLGFVKKVNLEDILIQSDIISLHLPLTPETKFMVNKEFLQKCKKQPVLINTSRGEVIHTPDLILALEQGWIKGACLDVFENEKTETYTSEEIDMYKKLFSFENVLVSPHIAGWTKESLEKIANVTLEKILRLF